MTGMLINAQYDNPPLVSRFSWEAEGWTCKYTWDYNGWATVDVLRHIKFKSDYFIIEIQYQN